MFPLCWADEDCWAEESKEAVSGNGEEDIGMMDLVGACEDYDIEPDDIEVNDTVTMMWTIK